MQKTRKWWVAAAAGVALIAAVGLGASVFAQTPIPGTSATGTTLIDRVAAKLGIESSTLSDAVKSAATDEIDERVASGELTQEQADQIKERIANAPAGVPLFGGGFRMGHGGPGGHGFFFAGDGLAEFLGITVDELRTQLQADGATLASVAEANGKSRDELKAFLTSEIKAHLDEAATAGRITQEEADAKLTEKTANLDDMIDRVGPPARPFRGGFPGAPGDMPNTPDSGTTPSDSSL